MKRKIYSQLLRWKSDDNGQNALLIDGARRVGKVYQSLYHFIFGKVCQKVQELPIDSLCHSHLRPSGKRWDSISATLYDTPAINQSQKRACINYILHTLFSFSPPIINRKPFNRTSRQISYFPNSYNISN